MSRSLDIGYGAGRLAFGATLFAAPRVLGRLLVGDDAERREAGVLLRGYGTRDVLLGSGAILAAATDRDAQPWIRAGVAADALDVVLQLIEWDNLPRDKRVGGVATALGAAAAGVALLARR